MIENIIHTILCVFAHSDNNMIQQEHASQGIFNYDSIIEFT